MLNKLAKEINDLNKLKGFWDGEDDIPNKASVGLRIALMHSELSEALEAHRSSVYDDKLPEYLGLHVELIDALIRILDFCGYYNINVDEIVAKKLEYNKSRPFKHGKQY